MSAPPPCRFCGAPLTVTFADLGETPLANNYVTAEEIARGMDVRYPLHARVCGSCLLVQAESAVPADAIFSHYPYFSSYSDSWVEHARRYAMEMTRRFHLGEGSLVVEVASNDGYLLQHFKALGVQVLGVEPAANVAAVAQAKGVATEVGFFGVEKARDMVRRGIVANLMAANNVLAHVPDIREFVGGFEILLGPEGVVTFEFPHVLNLINQVQFDTIYHEHYSYLSLVVVERVLATAKMRVFDVDELPTHGGSLRIYACHEASSHQATERVDLLRLQEAEALYRAEDRKGEIVFLGLPFPGQGAGKDRRRLRGGGQGQYISQRLRSDRGGYFSCLRSGSLEAGTVSAREPYPHSPPGAALRNPARLSGDPALESYPGNHRLDE